MKKQYIFLFILLLSLSSCLKDLKKDDFKDEAISVPFKIQIAAPQGHSVPFLGMKVIIKDNETGISYIANADEQGKAQVRVAYGAYTATTELQVSDGKGGIYIYNGSTEKVTLTPSTPQEKDCVLNLNFSKTSALIIKEIYYAGCSNSTTKSYFKDQYITLYNNSDKVIYLDSLCVGNIHPWTSMNKLSDWVKPGTSELRDSLPSSNIIWMFPGKGKDVPLKPGEDLVLCLNAIDHTKIVSNSVNLGVPGYYAMYHPIYTKSQAVPASGVNIMDAIWRAGTTSTYVFSNNSPGVFIYSLGGQSIDEFKSKCYAQNPKTPNNRNSDVLLVDKNLVLDGVECFQNVANYKRMRSEVDNGYAIIPQGTYTGRSVHRKVDEAATLAAGGRVVYVDTNNSLNDFELRENAFLTGK